MMVAESIFKTYIAVIAGFILVILYTAILTFTKRFTQINLPDIGSVWFQGSAIMGGLKLIIMTFIPLLNVKHNFIETDKIFTIYGGFCVIYISLRTLYSKIK